MKGRNISTAEATTGDSSSSTSNGSMSNPQATPSKQTGFKKFFRRSKFAQNNAEDGLTPIDTEKPPLPSNKASLASNRSERASKKGKRGVFSGLLSPRNNKTLSKNDKETSPDQGNDPMVITLPPIQNIGTARRLSSNPQSPESAKTDPIVNTSSPRRYQQYNGANTHSRRQDLFQWQDEMEEQASLSIIQQKQFQKERDGFCRRVDSYDGQVLHVEGKAAYELGNYLGGGVAGVVYEGHRLQPPEEYPVRTGLGHGNNQNSGLNHSLLQVDTDDDVHDDSMTVGSFLCIPSAADVADHDKTNTSVHMDNRDPSLLTIDDSNSLYANNSLNNYSAQNSTTAPSPKRTEAAQEIMALEATESGDARVIIDSVDAPSRSKHFAKAIMEDYNNMDADEDASFTAGGRGMQETVAIKILNPVGFRTLPVSTTQTAVVARVGEPLEEGVLAGKRPMEERHVWWLVNPNSRNLRTLQRYNTADAPRTVQVDRGSPEKGLRISLVAAFSDPETNKLRELPLTRCIEIWGQVPFGASDQEFSEIMSNIDRVNQGLPPQDVPSYIRLDEDGRVGTGTTTQTTASSTQFSMEGMRISQPSPINPMRTGIYRAAYTERKTFFCDELNAYIAIPAAPSKYLKWLRQRRAATKEIRNMMLIGRHRNVVHLFEVLELVQENKSTMFLILELVKGGELFELISSNAAKISLTDRIPKGFTESETAMRKFFRELASGIHYCHTNGIAHRDLKPENLLVHNSSTGDCVLKIADFGLSAAFGPNSPSQADQETVVESLISSAPVSRVNSPSREPDTEESPSSPSPMKQQMDKLLSAGGSALAFLTCGAVDDIICNPKVQTEGGPSPLKRMTSIVGSPHYVAPEIISQSETNKRNKTKKEEPERPLQGYDGTKADVWSAGVILYAMLFRSLPFGEDLLRCPRFQSYRKWYDEVKKAGGNNRRNNVMAALNPIITDADESQYLGPHWFFPSASSRESRDLIVYMLNPDPDMRPTVQLVLQHPWLIKRAD